jgi:hypothetical protein
MVESPTRPGGWPSPVSSLNRNATGSLLAGPAWPADRSNGCTKSMRISCGFVREGTRRKAYDPHGGWVDGVIFGLVREDLEER